MVSVAIIGCRTEPTVPGIIYYGDNRSRQSGIVEAEEIVLKGAFCVAVWCCGAERVSHEKVIGRSAGYSKQESRNRKLHFAVHACLRRLLR